MAEVLRTIEVPGPRRAMAMLGGLLAMSLMLASDQQPYYPEDLYLANPNAQGVDDDQLRIMTANVHGWEAPDGSNNLDDLLEVVGEVKPDVVCLQEVEIGDNQLERLYDAGYNVIYDETERDGYGNAILTAYQTRVEGHFDLPPSDYIRQRGASLVSLVTEVGDVRILNTHVTTNAHFRTGQFGRLAGISRTTQVNALCGDINSGAAEIIRSQLAEVFDIRQEIGQADTFPSHEPTEQIDYNLTRCTKEKSFVRYVYSDHLAVISDLDTKDCV
jgi:endonuclease/exonuclease/phosphatase family metal-dependent hydrolase